jgi:hypothetical protein
VIENGLPETATRRLREIELREPDRTLGDCGVCHPKRPSGS